MFDRFFQADLDSISCLRDPRGKDLSQRFRLFNLVWTVWVFADLIFDGTINAKWIIATATSFPVFLVLYQLANVRPRRQIGYYAAAMAALGYVVMTWNHSGGTTYAIYACAYFAFFGSVRQSVAGIAATIAVFALFGQWHHWPWVATIMMAMIGASVGAGNLFYRISSQKDAELRMSHDEVRRLAATAERERIGRDLHDLLGHTLSLITLKSELANKLFDRDAAAAKREMLDVERVARDVLAQVRHAVTGIRAAGFAAELASARLLLESNGVQLRYALADVALPVDVETVLAMTVREAATNIQRHARATSASVDLAHDSGRLVLRISDDGRGGAIKPGNGLNGMRERLAAIGAELRVDSQRGRGTTLTASLPMPQPVAGTATNSLQQPQAHSA
ncbi:MAG: sensor histidine kinase [Proteobacteria bacterium]|nr:sensor histidine kinase [Pseudomonadota bacterium]